MAGDGEWEPVVCSAHAEVILAEELEVTRQVRLLRTRGGNPLSVDGSYR